MDEETTSKIINLDSVLVYMNQVVVIRAIKRKGIDILWKIANEKRASIISVFRDIEDQIAYSVDLKVNVANDINTFYVDYPVSLIDP